MNSTSMRIVRLLPLVFVAALAGCGGGKNSVPDPSMGTLEAGKAQGVHFETATQSGVTDANGNFTYFPGESVTFSIGGVQLGAVPGAARISLFTLAGMTPPPTELALRRDLDRAMRLPTPLTRAMNIASLLIALDLDGNPDNGLDLASRANDLANKQIDLGLGLFAFRNRLDRLAPNLTRNIPMWRALTYLYQSANVTVPAHAPIRYDNTVAPGLLQSTTVTYHVNGAISGEVTEPGPLIFFAESRSTFTYDAMGRLLSLVAETLGSPFQSPSTFRVSNTYDARGNRIAGFQEREVNPGTLVSRTSFAGVADAWGHIPESTSTEDWNGDGVVDFRSTATETFDERGNSVASSFLADENADGVIESRSLFTRTLDANDRVRAEDYEADSNGDGVVDLRSSTTYEDDAPRSIVRTALTDDDADGDIDDRDIIRWTYDAAGNNVLVSSLSDRGTDGTTYNSAEIRMTYDGEHRQLSRVVSNDFEGDGIPDQTDQSTFVYDGSGNLLSATRDSDGSIPFGPAHLIVGYEYGTSGERTTFRSRADVDGDGVFETDSNTIFTNQEFADGVGLLAHQYFEGTANYADGIPIGFVAQ